MKICAVCVLREFYEQRLSLHGSDPGKPLFLFSDGSVLTKTVLNKHIKLCVALIGINPDNYTGHSLRAGGATDAAKSGLADWEIKLLGRWSSDTYQRYIRLPLEYRVGLARRMANTKSLIG